jgi:hypothetical protein
VNRVLACAAFSLVTVVSASASPIHVIEGTVTEILPSFRPSELADVGDGFVLRYRWEPYHHPLFPADWTVLYYVLTFESGWTVRPFNGSSTACGVDCAVPPVQRREGGLLLSDVGAFGDNPRQYVDHWAVWRYGNTGGLFLEAGTAGGPTIRGRVDDHYVLPEAPLFVLLATGLGLLAVFRLSRSPSIGLARSHRGAP